MLTVSEHSSVESFEALRHDWGALLGEAGNASVFATWEWTEAFWEHGVAGKRPLVLAARDGMGRLVGLLPLTSGTKLGVLRVLEVAGCTRSGYPVGDYGGPIAAKGMESAVWRAMLEHLKRSRWSIIDLRNCPTGDSYNEKWLAHLYESSGAEFGWASKVQSSDTCRLIALPETFEGYLGTLSSNARQNLRRKMRKLNEGGLVLQQVASVDDDIARDEALEALFTLHQLRWADDASGGSFPDAQARALHRYLASSLAAQGMVDLRLARSAEGQIIGVIYNFRWNGVSYFYTLGISLDPKWSSLSLGTCLLADSIRAAIESGCHTFDMLRGDHEYKAHFGGYAANNLRLTIYRYGWLPRAQALAASLRHRLKPRVNMQLQGEQTHADERYAY
jgi:CelD/BcsL family acetyltransferase involved in cellulose biosynthesis